MARTHIYPLSTNQERGIILLSLLVLGAVISLIVAMTFIALKSAVEMQRDEVSSARARMYAEKRVTELLTYPHVVKTQDVFECFTGSGESGRVTISRALCVLSTGVPIENNGAAALSVIAPRAKALPPIIDYNSIFSRLIPCNFVAEFDSELHIPITPGSLRSPVTCLSFSMPATNRYVLQSNLRLAQNIALSTSPRDGYVILSASGYLSLQGGLLLSSDALVIAGGDIYLDHIINTTSYFIRTTIISATGDITIKKISGAEIQLQALAYGELHMPTGVTSKNNGLMPTKPSLEVLGGS